MKAVGLGNGRYQRVSAAVLSDVIADNKEFEIKTKSGQSTVQPLLKLFLWIYLIMSWIEQEKIV